MSTNAVFEALYISGATGSIESTSFLSEGEIHYTAGNLNYLRGKMPWAEGASGFGIGEQVSFSSFPVNRSIHAIIISIGYVDYEKPYLYYYNSRPKILRIWYDQKSKYFDHDLIDSPDPQLINFQTEVTDFTLEILDIYEGTKWEDTCINFVLTVSGMKDYFTY